VSHAYTVKYDAVNSLHFVNGLVSPILSITAMLTP